MRLIRLCQEIQAHEFFLILIYWLWSFLDWPGFQFLALASSFDIDEADANLINYLHPGVHRGSNCQNFWISNYNTSNSPQCNCSEKEIKCINLQLKPRPPSIDSDFFLQFENPRFDSLESVVIHGNNLEHLPRRLFGPGPVQPPLKKLNLSANYFLHVHREAFFDLQDLAKLDLSDNEILLDDNTTYLFQPLSNIKELYLNRAFRYSQNKTEQVDQLEKTLVVANLRNLEVLEIGNNDFPYIPKKLGCHLPKLRRLVFLRNNVEHWDVDAQCFGKLEHLDLSWTIMKPSLYDAFTEFVNSLPKKGATVLLHHTGWECTTNIIRFMDWLNHTSRVPDKDFVYCYSASPAKYEGQQLLTVNPLELGCCISRGHHFTGSMHVIIYFVIASFLCIFRQTVYIKNV